MYVTALGRRLTAGRCNRNTVFLVGSGTPYELSSGDVILVPPGEEELFRGFLLVILLTLFRPRLTQSFFGLVAGWAKVRTNSLFGPVLLHSAMNIARSRDPSHRLARPA